MWEKRVAGDADFLSMILDIFLLSFIKKENFLKRYLMFHFLFKHTLKSFQCSGSRFISFSSQYSLLFFTVVFIPSTTLTKPGLCVFYFIFCYVMSNNRLLPKHALPAPFSSLDQKFKLWLWFASSSSLCVAFISSISLSLCIFTISSVLCLARSEAYTMNI